MRVRSDESLFGSDLSRDRELLGLAEAAALCGETPAAFVTGVQTGLYPQWNGYPDPRKRFVRTRTDKWLEYPRWRRGALEAAIADRDRKSVFR